jgi:hypothetical protein
MREMGGMKMMGEKRSILPLVQSQSVAGTIAGERFLFESDGAIL